LQYRTEDEISGLGEFLRSKENLTNIDYVEKNLQKQLQNFTEDGMYVDNVNSPPPAYDLFPRHYLDGMLTVGYRGKYFENYQTMLEKAAWMSLFLQSPFGEIPTGFRSSHHIWNEAEQCVVFEIYAKRYAAQGEKEKAEAFKRGAMLSLQNVKSWIRPDGSGYIVKNKYPIKSQHGYENYSVYACYNMLAMSMLAQAYQFADDSIQESVAPTDVGGYAIPLLIPFHKIIASSGSVYLEYDTRGDQQYNPTGMIRIHIKGSHPQLGQSDGCASKFSGRDVSIAVGPSWQNADGSWASLASLRQNPDVEILQETTDEVKLKIAYTNKRGADTVSVAETITIGKHHGITVEDNLSGNIQLLRITYPMLIFNGCSLFGD
jgi:hypothetical protein